MYETGKAPHRIVKLNRSLKKNANGVKSGIQGVRKGSAEIVTGIKIAKNKPEQIRRIKLKSKKSPAASKKIKTKNKTVKQAERKIKQGRRRFSSSGRTIKSVSSQTLQVSKSAQKAVENAKKAFHAKKLAERTAGGARRSVLVAYKVTLGATKIIVSAAKTAASFIKALAAGGALVVVAIAFIAMISVLMSSAFGIFFPSDDNSITMRDAVSRVNTQYNDKVNQIVADNDEGDLDLVRYTGRRSQWKYVIALYAIKYSKDNEEVFTLDENSVKKLAKVFFDMHEITVSFSQQRTDHGNILNVITVNTEAKTMGYMMNLYHFTRDQRIQARDLLDSRTDEQWTALLYGIDGLNSASSLVKIANEQVGTVGGQTYITWYGYKPDEAPKEWSGIFVSWCAEQAGLISQGLFPKFSNPQTGVEWFKNNGMWQEPNSAPSVGDIVFMDYNEDGIADRCFIITSMFGNAFHAIGATDEVYETQITLTNHLIMGFGMLPQMSGLIGDTVEEQCYNYLRADGYSELAACIVIANFQGECSCDPGIYSHDYGDAAGLMMWTGPNKSIFFNWCNDNAMNWRNLESQLYFYSYWLDVNSGEWGRVSSSLHHDFRIVYSTDEFKQLSADDYGGDAARALYEGAAMFVDDMERPEDTWGAETRRYTYAVQFYNFLADGNVDGTTQSAWRPEYANDIGVFHLN